MSAPRIKFRDEISIVKCASSDDDDDISETYASTRRNWPSNDQRDSSYFDDSSLKMRRENLEERIKSHCRTFSYTLPAPPTRKDIVFSDFYEKNIDYDVPANYVHVSTVGDIQPSETVSNSSRSVSRKGSIKSETSSKNDSKVSCSCTTVNRTFQMSAPWKPKFRPPGKSLYYGKDGNRID